MTPARSEIEDLVAVADDAAASADHIHQIGDAVRDAAKSEVAWALASAFMYSIKFLDRSDEPFEPMAVLTDGTSIPPAPTEAAPEVLEVWASAAPRSEHPRVRSRLYDLLYVAGRDRGISARAAVEGYLAMVTPTEPPDLRTTTALARASRLALLTGQRELRRSVGDAALAAAERALDSSDPKPGTTLGLAEIAVEIEPQSLGCADILDRCRTAFPEVHQTQSVIGLQRRIADGPDARRRLDRELAEAWLDAATAAEPMVAIGFRQKAIQVALDRGLPDVAERATLELQTAEPVELPRIRVDVPSTLTADDYEEFIESMVQDTWWLTMHAIIESGPPTGDFDRNSRTAADLAAEHPLSALFPMSYLGGDGLPRYEPTTEEDRTDDQVVRVETMALRTMAPLMAESLRRSYERSGLPDEAELLEHLPDGTSCDTETVAAVLRATIRLYEGDPEAAFYTSLPLVERVARQVLLTVDTPIYRTQRQKAPGQYPGLGRLVGWLERRALDPSWARFLRCYFTAPNGLNRRNEAHHGLLGSVAAVDATLVLMSVLFLSLLEPAPNSTDKPPPDGPPPMTRTEPRGTRKSRT